MAKFPSSDDEGGAGGRRKLTDEEVESAFTELSHQFAQESLTGPRDYVAREEEEPFIPPDPGPVASTDPFLNLGWILLAGGLLVILASLVFWPGAPRAFHIGVSVGVLAGGAILTWRMPSHKKSDDDDTGAVV